MNTPKHRKALRALFLAALVAALGAAQPRAPADTLLGPPLPSESPTSALEELLDYFYYASALPEDLLEGEYESVSAQSGHNPAEELRLAVLLSVPGTGLEDLEQARMLVAHYLDTHGEDDALARFAFFLAAFLNDSERRLQELRASRRKVEVLQRQLEQLKSIERSINQGGDTASLNEHIEGTGSPGR